MTDNEYTDCDNHLKPSKEEGKLDGEKADDDYTDCDNHLKPSKEEGKLDGEKEWIEQVQLRLCVSHWQAVSLLNKTS